MTYDVRRGTIFAVGLAVLLNLLVYFIGRNALDIPFTVANLNDPVQWIAVIIVSVITAVGAGIVFWLLSRGKDQNIVLFLWIALILGLLSLIPVYQLAIGRGTFVGLGLMHVFSTLSVLYGLLYHSACENC